MNIENVVPLDDKNDICIETGTNLIIKIEGIDSTVKSAFVGAKKDEYLAITPPEPFDSPIKDSLFEKKPFSIIYIYNNQMIEFQTKFLKLIDNPVLLILLEFPEVVKKLEKSSEHRVQKRINCFVSVKLEIKSRKKEGALYGAIKDITKKGCCYTFQNPEDAENPFQIDDQVVLWCHFPGIAGEQKAIGEVRYIQRKDKEIDIGIMFPEKLWWVPPYD